MANKRRNPHPNSPAGGGGPGGFRTARPLGTEHEWAGPNSTAGEPDLLNLRVPAELASHPGWMPDSSWTLPTTGKQQTQILAKRSDIDKLKLAVERALPKLPVEIRDKVKAMFTPEALGAMAAIAAVWGASHWVGVGELVDVLLVGWGVWTLGSEALAAGKDLYQFVTTATQAQSDKDVDRAADYLARAIAIVGVDGLAAILAHKAFKAVQEMDGTGSVGELDRGGTSVESVEVEQKPAESRLTPSPDENQIGGTMRGFADGEIPAAQREQVATEWYAQHPGMTPDKAAERAAGFDTNKPIVIKTLKPGTKLAQWVRNDGKPGMDFTTPDTDPAKLGLKLDAATGLPKNRSLQFFEVTKPLQVLQGTAGDFPEGIVHLVGGQGGGLQTAMPAGWQSSLIAVQHP